MAAFLIFALAAPATAANTHVRVVLDTSESMRRYDPDRLAPLATLLLYDLAPVNSTLDDSFEVIPFHPTQEWHRPSDPAPTGTGPRLRGEFNNRRALAQGLAGLRYDADWTYFYPGLREAVVDLEATPGGASDVRVIVLVTDGLPEDATRDAEERLIREELLPRLEAASIRLYVLAFGPQAYPRKAFFDGLVGGGRLGEVFADPDGSRLLDSMIKIFSATFGYAQDSPRRLPVGSLDLAGGRGNEPERAAVVLFWRSPTPPLLRLKTPQGGPVNMADGVVREGKESRTSYQMAWVLSPSPGLHPIDGTSSGATVAVLRPMPVTLEIRSPRVGGRVNQVMAGQEVPLDILVKPAAGHRGDPGAVNLTFQTHGEKRGGEYAWDGDVQAPPAGRDKRVAEGRIYPIFPKFQEPAPGQEFYVGHLTVTARRGARPVKEVYRLEVYPQVSIAPVPAVGDAVPEGLRTARALGRWERGCARFRLELAAGRLPDPEVSLRAMMPASTPMGGGLAGATWTLDGLPLEISGAAGKSPVSFPWTGGRALKRDDLFGREHTLCVQTGKPLAGTPGRPYELPLTLTLLKSPYDAFDVIQPFYFKVRIEPPTILEQWASRILLFLALTSLLAALWYLRARPGLPGDLLVAVRRADSKSAFVPAAPAEASLAARLLGLVGERAVVSESGARLGALKPVREGLYRFRPARGVRVETPEGQAPEMLGDAAALSVHRTYRLRQG
ncbi:MAG TPA: vWA domain-containing protein, partial [Thermoanaerobaculia bacterium]